MWQLRFEAKVNRNGPTPEHAPHLGPCHLWTGATTQGYGVLRVDGKIVRATHLAFELRHGRRPHPWALHHCDTPGCVNADHLFEGDQKANMADMRAKGRTQNRRGENHPRAKFTAKDVARVRAMLARGMRQIDIAAKMKCPRSRVADIATRRWKEVA